MMKGEIEPVEALGRFSLVEDLGGDTPTFRFIRYWVS